MEYVLRSGRHAGTRMADIPIRYLRLLATSSDLVPLRIRRRARLVLDGTPCEKEMFAKYDRGLIERRAYVGQP